MAMGFIGGWVLGITAHAIAPDSELVAGIVKYLAQPIGHIFIALLQMLVIPLLFSALVLGISGLGDTKRLGKMGLRTLVYTVVVSAIAVVIGLVLVNVFEPGAGIDDETRIRLTEKFGAKAHSIVSDQQQGKSPLDLLLAIVPRNPIDAMARGDMLAVMFFSLFVGIGLLRTQTSAARRFEEAVQGLYDVSMRLIGMVIQMAPIAVFALLFAMTAMFGWELIGSLARYVGVVLLALAIHQFGVYSLAVRLFGGKRPLEFFREIQEAMLTAFSTASSNATLPTAIRVADERLKLPPEVSRFVLTIGSTANQNGTALFEGVTVLFLAQVYGVDLSMTQQVTVLLVCILGGIGTAGVPAGSLPVVAMILGMVGVPPESIALILGVDRFLDMCRTTLNVTGDLAAAVVVAHGERDEAGAIAP
ncbi:MAG: dicarboxylate/amino acid:cation symporter [Myxococcales bacterium]|nr:dicarboxylate/amino acid:cation symporter [Myxococcales bacterium]